jgi:hypothetical protein
MTTHTVKTQDGSDPIPMDTWLNSLSDPQKTEFLRIMAEHGSKWNANPADGSAEWPLVWESWITSNNLVHTQSE